MDPLLVPGVCQCIKITLEYGVAAALMGFILRLLLTKTLPTPKIHVPCFYHPVSECLDVNGRYITLLLMDLACLICPGPMFYLQFINPASLKHSCWRDVHAQRKDDGRKLLGASQTLFWLASPPYLACLLTILQLAPILVLCTFPLS